jgi:hypothetical protein
MTRKTPLIADKKLSEALHGLREEVAAPRDFSRQVMDRLRAEGVLPKAARPSLWSRLSFTLTPARLGLAGASLAALLVGLWMLPSAPEKTAPEAAKAQAPVVAKVIAPRQAPVLAKAPIRRPSAPLPSAAGGSGQAPEPQEVAAAPQAFENAPAPSTSTQAAPAVGDAPAPSISTSSSIAAAPAAPGAEAPQVFRGSAPSGSAGTVSADAKPTVIVIQPTATAVVNPLRGNSEVRGNVVRASQGEAALVLFKVLRQGKVRAEIFNRLGQSVAVLKDAELAPGEYQLRWAGQADNGSLAPSGIYALRLSAPGYNNEHKLMLVK